jgi:hypothetical protein
VSGEIWACVFSCACICSCICCGSLGCVICSLLGVSNVSVGISECSCESFVGFKFDYRKSKVMRREKKLD